MTMFQPGDEIEFHYPVSTHVRLYRPDQHRVRYAIVRRIRDLYEDPLTLEEFLRRPFLRRSRYLIDAYEPETRQYRRFYLGSTLEFRAPSVLKIGLYEDGSNEPDRVFGRGFEATESDRKLMIDGIAVWKKHQFHGASLRVFSDDTRIVG